MSKHLEIVAFLYMSSGRLIAQTSVSPKCAIQVCGIIIIIIIAAGCPARPVHDPLPSVTRVVGGNCAQEKMTSLQNDGMV